MEQVKMRATVLGATGLVGKNIVKLLIDDDRFSHVSAIVRRSVEIKNDKLTEIVVDFDKPETYTDRIEGDIIFLCMGTTIKKAGSKDAQYKVDYTYQYNIAKAASDNDVKRCVIISSAMADPDARMFYPRMKGELERDVKNLNFGKIYILRPSVLKGEREEKRFGETAAARVVDFILPVMPWLKKYKPIEGAQVAKAAVNIGTYNLDKKVFICELNQLFDHI